jgi:4-hydroxybenzoyl-CoA thioesterase
MQPYRSEILVRFAHCDPAGIVFYPRYLEMFNNLVEDWCRENDIPFAELHGGRGMGLPTAHLEVDYLAPSHMGDVLKAELTVRAVGRSSISVDIVLRGADGADRVRGNVVLVLIDATTRRPIPIPPDVRSRFA